MAEVPAYNKLLSGYTDRTFHVILAVAHATTIGIIVWATENYNMVYILKEDVGGPEHQVNLMGMLLSISSLSFVYHTLYAVFDIGRSITINQPINRWRHLDYAANLTMVMFTLMTMTKLKFMFTYIASVGLILSTAILFAIQDFKADSIDIGNSPFWFALVPYLFMWVSVVKAFYNGINIFNNYINTYVYFVLWVEFFFITIVAVPQMVYIVIPDDKWDLNIYYRAYEGAHVLLLTIAKFVLIYGTLYGMLETS